MDKQGIAVLLTKKLMGDKKEDENADDDREEQGDKVPEGIKVAGSEIVKGIKADDPEMVAKAVMNICKMVKY